jgi:hypothetical protein
MKNSGIKYVLFVQGLYYSATALWALIDLESFFWLTQNRSDPFKTHSNAALFLVLGLFFLYSSFKRGLYQVAGRVAQGTAAMLICITVTYLLWQDTSWPFWIDAGEETLVFLILSFSYFLHSKHTRS